MNESLISGLILAGLKIKKIPSFESVIEVFNTKWNDIVNCRRESGWSFALLITRKILKMKLKNWINRKEKYKVKPEIKNYFRADQEIGKKTLSAAI